MKPIKPKKRSVSPFGLTLPVAGPFDELASRFSKFFKTPEEELEKLATWDDAAYIPALIEELYEAPANDADLLPELNNFLVQNWTALEQKELGAPVYEAMKILFQQKTGVFLIDHHDQESCQKQDWNDSYRDLVLFSKERDELVGGFFAKVTENKPGEFSKFVEEWATQDQPDPLLHFLDFCAGSKKPTFEYFLISAHPGLNRFLSNKPAMKMLEDKILPALEKLSSPTWEKDVRKALSL